MKKQNEMRKKQDHIRQWAWESSQRRSAESVRGANGWAKNGYMGLENEFFYPGILH